MPGWSQFVDLIELGLRVIADYTGNAGLSIIIFTILIKTLLLPLTIKSVRSTAAMQELQPKIRELQKKYGKDRQRLSAETMKLYQEYGVNPASGCLPLLLQMPIFFGLYFAVRDLSVGATGAWGNGFLWIPNLANADPYKALPILAGVFQFIQTRMTRPAGQKGKITDPQQQMMFTMMNFMPLMVVVFGWSFSAGPVLYWVTQSAYSVVQQWFITGWGSLLDWFPWLPDLPEHRRLGYESPEKRAARRQQSGGGLFGRLNQRIQQQIEQVESQPRDEGDGRAAGQRAGKGRAARTRQPAGTTTGERRGGTSRKTRSSRQKGSTGSD